MQLVRPFALTFDDYTVSLAETDAPVWDVGTTYALADEVIRDHRIYVSAIDGNTGNDPALENQNLTSARWLLKAFTNAYRFIDGTIGNRTTGAGLITIDVDNVVGAEALIIFGAKASTVRVQAFDGSSGETYDETISLSGRTVYTFYEWFTEPIGEVATKLVLTDLPSMVETLTLTIAGTVIEIGEIVIGDLVAIGKALYSGTEGQVKSYARTEINAYGFLARVPGPTRNIMTYQVHVPRAAFAVIKDILDRLAGELVGAIGSPSRPSTVQLGTLGAIRWPENLPDDYVITFQLDGVT